MPAGGGGAYNPTMLAAALALIPYPSIDPVLISFGPLAIRWYGLAYVVGLLLGWRYVLALSRRPDAAMTPRHVDDFLVWAAIGVVLGGRLGYALFYRPDFYLAHPLEALKVWQGGMSFHGGLLGVTLAMILFARRRGVALLGLSDLVAAAAPIGLFFGRLANFINAELVGRPSDVPWAMIFPGAGSRPRHPSQLYEAALEGLVLFVLLWWLARRFDSSRQPGLITGSFLVGYALARFVVEFYRQPDAHLGFLSLGATMGQWLSLPALLFGLVLIVHARRA